MKRFAGLLPLSIGLETCPGWVSCLRDIRSPGEDRSPDGTCRVDGGFVCLQLLDSTGGPRAFREGQDWWDITGQSRKWAARHARAVCMDVSSISGDIW